MRKKQGLDKKGFFQHFIVECLLKFKELFIEFKKKKSAVTTLMPPFLWV